jgi:formylglycine-generating enzyme required for sulfatase activity
MLTTLAASCGKDDKPTTPPTGSCCTADGACTVTTQGNCIGVWTAAGVCEPNPCPPPSGSCCTADGTCTVTTQGNCTGIWTAAGVCEPNPCLPPTGSCCAADGTCTVTTEGSCSGVWTEGGDCSPNLCPQSPPGMVLIPAGTFTMGSPATEPGRGSDETQHQVTLTKNIYVAVCEVTQSEWQAEMGWNESDFQGANRPVEKVNWYDAVRYCNQWSTTGGYTPAYTITDATYDGNHVTSATVTWNQAANGYRLPTEAEWEYSCRATSTSAFCNGGITSLACTPLDPNLNQVGWYCGNAPDHTTRAVGGKTANAWGLKDMHGNVLEWCWDWSGDYSEIATDPTGPASGSQRVNRGGGWIAGAQYCRSAYRDDDPPGSRQGYLGLRLFMTAP